MDHNVHMSQAAGRSIILTLAIASSVYAFTNGAAFIGRTGAPGEGTCQDCHTTSPLNSGNGSFQVSFDRTHFLPGDTVNLRIDLQDEGQRLWAFQMTVLDRDELLHGKFRVIDSIHTRTPLDIINDRQYAEQTAAGLHFDIADSSLGWVIQWVAPLGIHGPALFYAAGCAANLDSAESGDFIYTTKAVLPMAAASCCTPSREYIDCNSGVDISDLTVLVDNLFGTFTPVCCDSAADLDNNASVDIADLTKLIDHLFVSLEPLQSCS